MWFTRVSLKNPVFATMVMLAFVVMGLFAFQKLKVINSPTLIFRWWWFSRNTPALHPKL
jgi:HAE1 family hydrophobic/amphiphilic exporter-1